MSQDPELSARQLEQARKEKVILRGIALFVVLSPFLWGAACVLEHRRGSRFYDASLKVVRGDRETLTRSEVRKILSAAGSEVEFSFMNEIREFGDPSTTGDTTIVPASGDGFCYKVIPVEPSLMTECLFVAYDKSDRIIWTHYVIED